MGYTNSAGAVVVLVIMTLNGELVPAMMFFIEFPNALLLLAIRSSTFLVGTLAYTALLKEFGAVSAMAAATGRKIITVLVSFCMFPKPFCMSFVFGVIAFILADLLYLQNA